MTDATTTEAAELPEWLTRRGQIIRLLETMNDGLPEISRRDHSTSGFVNKVRSRTCPDCLANGRVMIGCETCGGSGEVRPPRLGAIAAPDALPDDGAERDPYQENKTQPYGLTNEARDREVAIDSAIARASDQLRRFPGFRPASARDEVEEANRSGGYPWERERRAAWKRYDYERLTVALDELRVADEAGYHLLHSVFVYGWSEPSGTMEMVVERALRFLDGLMPTPMRAPGDPEHPAAVRQRRRAA